MQRRHAELDQAIGQRQWFDPWVFPLDDEDSPTDSVLPWVAGFAAAMDHFPALMAVEDPELIEPLALLYLHFDPADLEDADALAAVIETLEPPADLAEAVQDMVRAVMLIADVTRPRIVGPTGRAPPAPRRGAPAAEGPPTPAGPDRVSGGHSLQSRRRASSDARSSRSHSTAASLRVHRCGTCAKGNQPKPSISGRRTPLLASVKRLSQCSVRVSSRGIRAPKRCRSLRAR